jgi:mRNA-degrading endonuclease toxin of MazEF toxin-antitoxin module
VETPVREVRPALVISSVALGPNHNLFWAAMITSAANRGWAGDVSIEADYQAFGLTAPSVIRTEKIAVLEADTASLLGRVSDQILSDVRRLVMRHLGG